MVGKRVGRYTVQSQVYISSTAGLTREVAARTMLLCSAMIFRRMASLSR